jgi:AcrR family transcriptional regulator
MQAAERTASVPVLSRPVIEAAALALADREGLAALSLRNLAEDLAVTPMAIYRHVGGKDDLLQSIADARLSELGLPSRRYGWPRFLFDLARSLRALFQAEPELLGLFTRRPVTSPAAISRFEAAQTVLVRAGFSIEAATEAYAAVHTYTIGFCALEAGRRATETTSSQSTDERAQAISRFVTDEQFEVGLNAMLAGLRPGARPTSSPGDRSERRGG